jgi:large subunit ribosomal protein L19
MSVKDQKYIFDLEKKFLRTDLPEIRPGYVVRVWTKVKEKDKERLSHFDGIVISIRGRGAGKTFTVRNIVGGVGVERIFPYYSPYIEKIEILRKIPVRRAKLYYLRYKKQSELFRE